MPDHELEPLFELWFTDGDDFRRYWLPGHAWSAHWIHSECRWLVDTFGPGAAPNVRLAC